VHDVLDLVGRTATTKGGAFTGSSAREVLEELTWNHVRD
jgi:hypothetical protein